MAAAALLAAGKCAERDLLLRCGIFLDAGQSQRLAAVRERVKALEHDITTAPLKPDNPIPAARPTVVRTLACLMQLTMYGCSIFCSASGACCLS